jgi:hypothetical protein
MTIYDSIYWYMTVYDVQEKYMQVHTLYMIVGAMYVHLGTWTIRISWDISTYLTYPDLSATYG